ncbi:MAG: Gfo/Idh/MocA family oxidoreductase [Phycisphaerales bacterium]|nr:MAG: Gfo/Idh/MocA family oxidoreductase [Phycisphaerales bacterium]
MNTGKAEFNINRRKFLHSAAAAGAGLALSRVRSAGAKNRKKPEDVNIALLGAGSQGHRLVDMICRRNVPGIRIKAVCDIWTKFNQEKTSLLLQRYKHTHNVYEDYREMLNKEKGNFDAVIVATPDFWHSRHAVACLEAGLHVYCEAEMSNTVEGARAMVKAAKRTGKLLQIGRQRRSNPRYIQCYNKLLKEAKLLGRITTVYGQYNRSKLACKDRSWPDRAVIDNAKLEEYEFESMHQFRNWRWYRCKSGGPIAYRGSHQIDIYNWFLDANPRTVIADGGTDYWSGRESYDSVTAIYTYETKEGTVRALYQTITTNDSDGYYEKFMGDEGTLVISQQDWRTRAERQWWVDAGKWQRWIKKGYLKYSAPAREFSESGIEIIRDPSLPSPPPTYVVPTTWQYKDYPLWHLENFFDAIRDKAKLNCPAEVGYKTAVAVLKVNEAVEAERKLRFKPEEFVVHNPQKEMIEHVVEVKLPESVSNCRYHSKSHGMGRGTGWGFFEISRVDLLTLLDTSDNLPDASEFGQDSHVRSDIEKYLERTGESIAWWKPSTLRKRQYANKIIGGENVTGRFELIMLPAINICVGEIQDDRMGVYFVYHCG